MKRTIEPKSESDVQQLIVLESPLLKCTLLRNNSGAGLIDQGKYGVRQVRWGLGNTSKAMNEVRKSSDEIGWTEVVITPEMVGKKVAVFTAVECKEPKWKWSGTPEEMAQFNFIKSVLNAGGMGGFAKSVDDFKQILKQW